MLPDLSFLNGVARGGVLLFAMYVSRVCIHVRGSRFFFLGPKVHLILHAQSLRDRQWGS